MSARWVRLAGRGARAVPGLAVRALRYEVGMWRSLFRWVLRRPPVGPGAQPVRYAGTVTPLLIVFIAVSAIEIPVVHLILPWETVRFAVDLAGAYGLLWMIGLLASLRAYPHAVDDAGLRVRNGFSVDLTIPWEAVAAVRSRGRSTPTKRSFHVEQTDAGAVAHVGVMNQTNVDIVLTGPTAVRRPDGRVEHVTEVRVYADDPAPFIARARRHTASTSSPANR